MTTLSSKNVAQFLSSNPSFFDEYANLLSEVRLASPVSGRTLSLQERQLEVLREKYKTLELRLADFLRHGQDNDVLIHKFCEWTRALLLARNDIDLPQTLISSLQTVFDVPQISLRLWRVAPAFTNAWFTQNVSASAKNFAKNLSSPYCGINQNFDILHWLEHPGTVQSTAIIPLCIDNTDDTFGAIVLGSDDIERFSAKMATRFLSEIGKTASAALINLLD